MVEAADRNPEQTITDRLAFSARELAATQPGLSPATSLALVFLNEGHNNLLEVSKLDKEQGSVVTAPDPNVFFNSLAPKIRPKVLEGLGFVVVGSLVMALEETKASEIWNAGTYVSYFNEHIRNTPFPSIREDLKRKAEPDEHSTNREFIRIKSRYALDKENNLAVFLKDPGILPEIVKWHLSIFPQNIQKAVFTPPSLLFVRAMDKLNQLQLPPEEQKGRSIEEQRTFLASIDQTLADIDVMIALESAQKSSI